MDGSRDELAQLVGAAEPRAELPRLPALRLLDEAGLRLLALDALFHKHQDGLGLARLVVFLVRGRNAGRALRDAVARAEDEHHQIGRADALQACDLWRIRERAEVLRHHGLVPQGRNGGASGGALRFEAADQRANENAHAGEGGECSPPESMWRGWGAACCVPSTYHAVLVVKAFARRARVLAAVFEP